MTRDTVFCLYGETVSAQVLRMEVEDPICEAARNSGRKTPSVNEFDSIEIRFQDRTMYFNYEQEA